MKRGKRAGQHTKNYNNNYYHNKLKHDNYEHDRKKPY